MTEVWKAIPGFEGLYEVSDHGRVRSLDRTVTTGCRWGGRTERAYRGRPIKATPHKGYDHVTLCSPTGNRTAEVQVLVAEAFLGPRPRGHEVCHEDGNPANNRVENLRYDTAKGNHADKKRHGTQPLGEKHCSAKLTEESVKAIRARTGQRLQDIADDFCVSRSLVSLIQRGERWTHV